MNAPANASQQQPSDNSAQEKVISASVAGRDTEATASDQQPDAAVAKTSMLSQIEAQEAPEPVATAPHVAPAVAEGGPSLSSSQQEAAPPPAHVPVSASALQSQTEPEGAAARADASGQLLGKTAVEAASSQPAVLAALPDKEEPGAPTGPTATVEPSGDERTIRTEPGPGADQTGVGNDLATQETLASADAGVVKHVHMQPSELVSIPSGSQPADSALPAQSSLQIEAAAATVKPPASEPVTASVNRLEGDMAAPPSMDQQKEDQDFSRRHASKADGPSAPLGGFSAARLPAAAQSMQPEVAPSNSAVAASDPAVAAANFSPSDPSSVRRDEMGNVSAASSWQQQSEAQMLAARTEASLMHMGLPIYQHGWLPLLATHLTPSSNQLGGSTPQPAALASSSSAQPYRQTPAMSIALQAGMSFLPGTSQPSGSASSSQQQVHVSAGNGHQPPGQALPANPSSSNVANSTGNSSFLYQKMRHTGGLAEILAKVGQPVRSTPPLLQPQQPAVVEQQVEPAPAVDRSRSAAAGHAEPVQKSSEMPQLEALLAVQNLLHTEGSHSQPSAEPQAALEGLRQPQVVGQQAASGLEIPQGAELLDGESRGSQTEAFRDIARQTLPSKRKAEELTPTDNAEQMEANHDEAERAQRLPTEAQEPLIAAKKSRKVSPTVINQC